MDWIYNPKDIHHNPYFIIKDNDIFLNKECILSERDYERMCDIKWVNQIYPNWVATKKESLKDLLARKRKELWHTL